MKKYTLLAALALSLIPGCATITTTPLDYGKDIRPPPGCVHGINQNTATNYFYWMIWNTAYKQP